MPANFVIQAVSRYSINQSLTSKDEGKSQNEGGLHSAETHLQRDMYCKTEKRGTMLTYDLRKLNGQGCDLPAKKQRRLTFKNVILHDSKENELG